MALEGELEELYHELDELNFQLEEAKTDKARKVINEQIDDVNARICNAESED